MPGLGGNTSMTWLVSMMLVWCFGVTKAFREGEEGPDKGERAEQITCRVEVGILRQNADWSNASVVGDRIVARLYSAFAQENNLYLGPEKFHVEFAVKSETERRFRVTVDAEDACGVMGRLVTAEFNKERFSRWMLCNYGNRLDADSVKLLSSESGTIAHCMDFVFPNADCPGRQVIQTPEGRCEQLCTVQPPQDQCSSTCTVLTESQNTDAIFDGTQLVQRGDGPGKNQMLRFPTSTCIDVVKKVRELSAETDAWSSYLCGPVTIMVPFEVLPADSPLDPTQWNPEACRQLFQDGAFYQGGGRIRQTLGVAYSDDGRCQGTMVFDDCK